MSFQPPYRSSNPFEPTVAGKPQLGPAPPVHFWFKVYCVVGGCFAALFLLLGIFFFYIYSSPELLDEAEMNPPELALLCGIIYTGIGIAGMGLFFSGLIFNRRQSGWIYGIVLICLGMMNICTLPACIPLLIFWIRTDNKNAIIGQAN